MLELDDESKIIKKSISDKKYVLGCKRSVHPTQEAGGLYQLIISR